MAKKHKTDGATKVALQVLTFLRAGKWTFTAQEIVDHDKSISVDLDSRSINRYLRNPLFKTLNTEKGLGAKYQYQFVPEKKMKSFKGKQMFKIRTDITESIINLGPDFMGRWFKTWTKHRDENSQAEDEQHKKTIRKAITKIMETTTKKNVIQNEMMGLLVGENQIRTRTKRTLG